MDARLRRLIEGFPLVNGHPDVAGVLRDPELLALLGPLLADPWRDAGVTHVVAPEARGPILGALVALELGAGLVLARKAGRNHPGADLRIDSAPTWRGSGEGFVARSGDFRPTGRLLGVDDWVTTGSSLRAVKELVTGAGAEWVGAAALVRKSPEGHPDPERDERVERELGLRWLVAFGQLVQEPASD